ncbi:MAG: DUF4340 domain-containing protein [Planctomycetota bacterium]
MRLRPALIMLCVFLLVIGGLALLVATYEAPTTEELMTLKQQKLFPGLDPARITKVEIISPGAGPGPVVIVRAGRRKWRMTQPATALASNDKLTRIAGLFAALEAARGYSTKNFADYELEEPRCRVTVTADTGETFTVAFGTDVAEVVAGAGREYVDFYTLEQRGGSDDAIPHRYARVGGRAQVLIVKDTLCREIDVPPAGLREPALAFTETADDIVPVALADVGRVAISVGEEGETRAVSLANVAGRWRVVSPVDARADARKVAEMLELLVALRAAGPAAYVDDAPADLARYGLAEPTVTVELSADDGAGKHTIHFGGGREEKDGLVCARSSSRKSVLLVNGGVLAKGLREDVEFFRDRRVVEFALNQVQSVSFVYASGRPTLTVARRIGDPANWRIDGAVSGRADAAVGPLITRLGALGVEPGGFVSEDPGDLAKFGLDRPQITATVTLKGEAPAKVLIGGSPKDNPKLVYAKSAAEPSIVLVSRSIIDDLTPDPASLLTAVLVEGYDRWAAFELEIKLGEKKIKLVRGERLGWKFVSPEGPAVDYPAPSNFLAEVAALTIKAWPADKPEDYAPFGLDVPRAVLTVRTRQDDPGGAAGMPPDERPVKTFVLHFGAATKDGKRCYVRLAEETNVYEVDAAILDKVLRGALLFREKTVLDFEPHNVKSLRLEGGRADYTAQRAPGGRWLLSRPLLTAANFANVKKLIDGLDGLGAVELVAEGGLEHPKYGLSRPHRLAGLIIEVEPPGAVKEGAAKPEKVLVSKTLVVGAPAPGKEKGGRYAAIREDKLAFVMAAEDIEKLDTELVTRTVVNILKGNVATVSVVHRDGSAVEVARRGAGWAITSHKDVEPDVIAVEKLVEQAGWVMAEGYVQYNQENLAKYGLAKPLLTVTVGRKEKLPSELLIGDAAPAPAPKKDGAKKDERKKSCYATGGGIPAVFLVAEEKVNALGKHVEDLIRKK